jgi:hypothetical protein
MAYTLNPLYVDSVRIRGYSTTAAGKKRWNTTVHGVCAGAGATSAQLATALTAKFTGGPITVMNQTVTTTDIQIEQIVGWRAKYGAQATISITIAAGVITAAVVNFGGIGYVAPGIIPIVDPTNIGFGGELSYTVTGGAISGVTVTSGGSSYSAGSYAYVPLPATNGPNGQPNRREIRVSGTYFGTYGQVGGVSADDPLPGQCAYSTQLTSAQGGRNGRGSSHIVGIPESYTTDCLIGNAGAEPFGVIAAAIQSYYPTAPIAVGTTTWQMGVLSVQQLEGGPPAPPNTSTYCPALVSATLKMYIGSMKRRTQRQA